VNKHSFPALDPDEISATRDALHTYSAILGGWASTCRASRKHWWHASLRPSLNGLTTGVIYADKVHFEIELNFRESRITVCTATGEPLLIELHGQAAVEPASQIQEFLQIAGVSEEMAGAATNAKSANRDTKFGDYSSEHATKLARALSLVSSALVSFRAGVREETSPIQLWPHHFDLAMLWLPGDKIPGQDSDNEEHSDKQMNFGFTFGDEGIPEPYFYVTAYPSPDAFSMLGLPDGTHWKSDGFTGAVLTYRRLLEEAEPTEYLLRLWNQLLAVGRKHLLNHPNQDC
jgi:hypothetical protein